jgi:gliding motility-associated protein GldE
LDTFSLDITGSISDLSRTLEVEIYIFLAVFMLFLFGLLTVLSAFETAFFSLTDKEEEKIKRSTRKNHQSLQTLLSTPLQTLGTIVFCHYTLLITAIMISVLSLNKALELTVLPKFVCWIIVFFVITFAILLFNELFPELLKKRKRLSFLYRFAGIIRFLSFVFRPFVYLFLHSASIVEKRLETKTYRAISIDELSETLKLKAVEKKEEKEILQGIVNFGRINVDEIMKPRVDIVDVDLKSDFETVIRIIRESEYSRLPVYEGSIDNIKGILYIKDLLKYLDKGKSFDWQSLIREAYFIPETKKIDDLLKEFQSKHIHMAIVVDEFGGTSGIVTLEDILEVIVGDICDEHDDDEQKLYSRIDDRNYVLEGKLLVNDFYKIPNVDKDDFTDIDSDADTLAGLLLEIKGDIPVVEEVIEYKNYTFQIVSADNRRIKRVKMQIS